MCLEVLAIAVLKEPRQQHRRQKLLSRRLCVCFLCRFGGILTAAFSTRNKIGQFNQDSVFPKTSGRSHMNILLVQARLSRTACFTLASHFSNSVCPCKSQPDFHIARFLIRWPATTIAQQVGPATIFHFFDLLPWKFPRTSVDVSMGVHLLPRKEICFHGNYHGSRWK